MAEKTNAKPAAENAEQNVQEEKKPEMKAEKKGAKKDVAEKKKNGGFFTNLKEKIKNHKGELIAGGIGVATGIAGTIGVSEYGKRQAEKKARNACIPSQADYSPIDPNV